MSFFLDQLCKHLSDMKFWLFFLQVPVYKEPSFTIPGTPGIVQHEILNNKRHVLTKVIRWLPIASHFECYFTSLQMVLTVLNDS